MPQKILVLHNKFFITKIQDIINLAVLVVECMVYPTHLLFCLSRYLLTITKKKKKTVEGTRLCWRLETSIKDNAVIYLYIIRPLVPKFSMYFNSEIV